METHSIEIVKGGGKRWNESFLPAQVKVYFMWSQFKSTWSLSLKSIDSGEKLENKDCLENEQYSTSKTHHTYQNVNFVEEGEEREKVCVSNLLKWKKKRTSYHFHRLESEESREERLWRAYIWEGSLILDEKHRQIRTHFNQKKRGRLSALDAAKVKQFFLNPWQNPNVQNCWCL